MEGFVPGSVAPLGRRVEEDLEEDQDLFETPLVNEVGMPDRFSMVTRQIGEDFSVLSLEFLGAQS